MLYALVNFLSFVTSRQSQKAKRQKKQFSHIFF